MAASSSTEAEGTDELGATGSDPEGSDAEQTDAPAVASEEGGVEAEAMESAEGDDDWTDDEDEDEGPDASDRLGRVHQVLAVASLVLSGVSLLGSLVVVSVLRKGLDAAQPDHSGLLGQVNPWYAAAIGTFLAALLLLVAWGVLNLRRAPVGQRGPGVVPAGVGLAFAGLAWAYSFYQRIG